MKKRKKEFRFFWEEPFERAERFFREPFEFRFTFPRIPSVRTIPISMNETDKELIIRADLPGFKKNEINLNVTENFIDISAAKKRERIEQGEKMYYHERASGALRRAFSLPVRIDPDKTVAKLDDGVLTVTMPKLEPSTKKKRKIEIK